MLNTGICFSVHVKGQKEDELWIDFNSRKEKWDFIQKHLPDMAKFIVSLNSEKDYKLTFLLVSKSWLESLDDVQINY